MQTSKRTESARAKGSGIQLEAMEKRTMFAGAAPTPLPPPPPPPGVTLVKGQLSIVADPKKANTISVTLSKDGKSINVLFDGKATSYKVSTVGDVAMHDGSKSDSVTVDLSGLAPKSPPKNPPPPPPAGVTLKNGLLTIAGNPKVANNVALSLSKDGKSVIATLDGKTTVFSAALVGDITVFDGAHSDSVSVNLGALKLKHPVLVHGGFARDVITGGGFNFDLPLLPPPPPPPAPAS